MKRTIIVLLACMLATVTAFAQGLQLAAGDTYTQPTILQAPQPVTWSGSAFYNVQTKHAAGVVFNRIGELTSKEKPTGVEIDGLIGAQNSKGTPATFGFAAIWHRKLFDQVNVLFGVGVAVTGGKLGGGPIAGVSISF